MISKKHVFWDYFILSARFLIGFIFISYGYSKLINNQFGLSAIEMSKPLKETSLFRLSWYLFDQQPFKGFIGISQMVCGLLIIYNRTLILGAFIFLPIAINILVIDLTIMPSPMSRIFAFRFSFYIILDLLILYHYKEKILIICQAMMDKVNTRYKFSVWWYLLLPISAIILEIIGALPSGIINVIKDPNSIKETFVIINKLVKSIF
ncbi:hypothetical protein [Chryseobacterium sp. ISL-6]|uniref:hypothetical protein n=1 Tax=Chryseobacterium sp. ISL-6 TaxID=2819143 RepID=UPI001BE59392|nr:hypothetical protein [Chryseobacterium sp. ISL-6]MBT2620621.1 hypothetical protein [Chryseobacterium sp. ISL-6]